VNGYQFPPHNDSESKVNKAKIAVVGFFKPDKQFPESVNKGMGHLDNPTSGFEIGVAFQLLLFFAPWPYMGYVPPCRNGFLFADKARVKAKVLRAVFSGGRAKYHKVVKSRFQKFGVMPVGTANHHRDWQAVAFRQHVSLGAFFFPCP